VRDLTSSSMVEFVAPVTESAVSMTAQGPGQEAGGQAAAGVSPAQWLGASPSTSVLAGGTPLVGVQSMRMMPTGVSAISFIARYGPPAMMKEVQGCTLALSAK
jgi:hypothetical protein